MIAPSNRALAVELIQEANQNGARLAKACQELHISVRTYERWVSDGGVKVDQRPLTKRPTPKNKLSQEEKEEIITIVKQEEYVDLPPTQIVPKLADKGTYIASESTFYRVLRKKRCKTTEAVIKDQNEECPRAISQLRQIKCGHGISHG
jgi:putative transposase